MTWLLRFRPCSCWEILFIYALQNKSGSLKSQALSFHIQRHEMIWVQLKSGQKNDRSSPRGRTFAKFEEFTQTSHTCLEKFNRPHLKIELNMACLFRFFIFADVNRCTSSYKQLHVIKIMKLARTDRTSNTFTSPSVFYIPIFLSNQHWPLDHIDSILFAARNHQ